MKIDNFIGIFEDAFTPEFCKKAIDYFDAMKEQGFTVNRMIAERISKISKDDEMLFTYYESCVKLDNTREINAHINDVLFNKCYAQYAEEFSILNDYDRHGSYSTKIQKTEIGGGYHIWHSEDASKTVSGRILAWIIYLNDVEEGGETEFLYLHKRIKPKAGTMVIWPAGFTHTHRGNPPISNSKYIVTGWIEF